MHLDRPNEHILHHQRRCGGLANILDMIHRAKRSCLLICYLYLAQLNLFGKKKIKDANTGSAVGSEYLLIKKVRKTPLIILIDSFGRIYALVFVQLHQVFYIMWFWQQMRSVRVQPCPSGSQSQAPRSWGWALPPVSPTFTLPGGELPAAPALRWDCGGSGAAAPQIGTDPGSEDLQRNPPGSNTLTSRCFLSRNVSAWPGSLLAPGRRIIANSQCSVVAKPSGMETENRVVWAARGKGLKQKHWGTGRNKWLCWGRIRSRRSWLRKLEKR